MHSHTACTATREIRLLFRLLFLLLLLPLDPKPVNNMDASETMQTWSLVVWHVWSHVVFRAEQVSKVFACSSIHLKFNTDLSPLCVRIKLACVWFFVFESNLWGDTSGV